MRPTLPGRLIFALCALTAVLAHPAALRAQDEQPSLGELARDVRKSKAQAPPHQAPDPLHPIIDNDNLSEVMEDAKRARPEKPNKTVFSIDAASNTVKVSSPDVTCSLSFDARASALLVKPVLVEDLPSPSWLRSTVRAAFRKKTYNWKFLMERSGTCARLRLA